MVGANPQRINAIDQFQHNETDAESPYAAGDHPQELDADLRWKKNNLREYLAQREKEK